MPLLVEDAYLNGTASRHDIAELEDCAIAIDATYYLSQLLDTPTSHEPLLPALGGLTGVAHHFNVSLDQWEQHKITPFFIFNGQSITGQDEVALRRAQRANEKTTEAWDLYNQSQADKAVSTFGANPGAFRVESLYPLLQKILKSRNLHFLVPPYNAAAQMAYFEMIDSGQCAGVMGPQELLIYPIKDSIIRSFDFENKTVTALSKKKIMRILDVSEPMFIDAMLMAGTSFLDTFPALLDKSMYETYDVSDVVNLLRTLDKGVANACAHFNDILQAKDPNWLDKYRRARLAAHHFIYIDESGEIRVNDYEHLTQDNHEYLGLQLPAELFHYLNTGLIGSRILNSITHGQVLIQPTLDGVATDDYKALVTSKIIPVKEQTLGLIIPRVHRGIGHKAVNMRVWFDPKFSYTLNHSGLQPPPAQKVGSWDVKESDIRTYFPADFAGPVSLEVLALVNEDFVSKTTTKEKIIRGIDSAEMVTSVAIWRFLHLRGYVDDSHKLTAWGNALATALLSIREPLEDATDVPGLDSAVLLAFELIKLGLLTGRTTEGHQGYPRKGSEADRRSLALISECASLLKLRHGRFGYTGPLNKSILMFRGLSSTVREAGRDLIEAIVASMFMFGQSKRERDDYLEISQRLPFSEEPDIGLGIAFRTFFDEDNVTDTQEARAARLQAYPQTYVPHAEALTDDFRICTYLVDALSKGLQIPGDDEFSPSSKADWVAASAYCEARPF